MLFSNDKKTPAETKSRSWFGLMFGFRLGDDVRPLFETIALFVRMVASLFVTVGLFPKDHPAFTDSKVRLTMIEVVTTAWRSLVFDEQHLFQIFLFFSVLGGLALAAFFVIVFLFSLLAVPAHAATSTSTGMFVPSDTTNDWGLNWLNYTFLGQTIGFMDSTGSDVSGLGTDCGWRTGLSVALAYYSTGILVVAGVILLYQLLVMVADTAYHGTPMGRQANQVWAPIRLVVAIGLLVPVGSSSSTTTTSACSMGGLNTGQYIVVQVAKWGSGLATNVWEKFRTALLASSTSASSSCSDSVSYRYDGTILPSSDTDPNSPSCVHISPAVRNFAFGMISNLACMYIYNNALGSSATTAEKVTGNSTTHLFGDNMPGGADLCGGYKQLDVSKMPSSYQSVYEAQSTVLGTFIENMQTKVENIYLKVIPQTTEADAQDNVAPNSDDFYDAVLKLQENLDSATQTALKKVDQDIASQKMNSDSLLYKGGWLAAGAWFNDIAREQSQRSDAVNGALPQIIEPSIYARAKDDRDDTDIEISDKAVAASRIRESIAQSAVYNLKWFNGWLHGGLSTSKTKTMAAIEEQPMGAGSDRRGIDKVFGLVNAAGGAFGLWNSEGVLAVKFDKSRNPFQEVVAFGQSSVAAGLWMIAAGGGANLAGTAADILGGAAGSFAGAIVGAMGGVIMSIGTIFMMFGVLLGYWLPLSPFVRFFFGSLTWIIGVFEAVVAMPLFSLAHLNPKGEGLAGDNAKRGYYLIFNLFLRPVLMIFGLIAGYILFVLGVAFLNTMFIYAAKGATTMGGGSMPAFARMVYSIVYCALVYSLGNNCFKAVGMFPQHALAWLGGAGGAGHFENMGDHQLISSMAGYMGMQAISGNMQSLANMPKEAAGAAHTAHLTGKEKLASAEEQEMLRNMAKRLGLDANGLPAGGAGDPTARQQAGNGRQGEGSVEDAEERMQRVLASRGNAPDGDPSRTPGDTGQQMADNEEQPENPLARDAEDSTPPSSDLSTKAGNKQSPYRQMKNKQRATAPGRASSRNTGFSGRNPSRNRDGNSNNNPFDGGSSSSA
jgi:conjugal transfer/type IV secretion protein DotA/TraY